MWLTYQKKQNVERSYLKCDSVQRRSELLGIENYSSSLKKMTCCKFHVSVPLESEGGAEHWNIEEKFGYTTSLAQRIAAQKVVNFVSTKHQNQQHFVSTKFVHSNEVAA